jgi:hypothetical protein
MPNLEFNNLMDSLRTAPHRVIHGVVYPSGVGASKSQGDVLWHMTFSLAAWANPDGPVQRTKVLVRRDIDDSELESYRERLTNYGVVALEVGLVEDSTFGGPHAFLHAVLTETPTNDELFRVADDLRNPATTEDQLFGTFTLDRRVNWHEAQTVWGVDSVRLALSSDSDDETFPQDSLAHARTLWSEQERWNGEIRDYMVKELLDLKNGNWLDEDEAELTKEEFLDRVSLKSITVSSDGRIEFWYADGDMFDHSIMVSGSLDGGIDDAGIHG